MPYVKPAFLNRLAWLKCPLWVTTSRSKPPHGRSTLQPTAVEPQADDGYRPRSRSGEPRGLLFRTSSIRSRRRRQMRGGFAHGSVQILCTAAP
jgi:hypothetical protein